MVTVDIHKISNSVWVGNEKPQAMQWIHLKQAPTSSSYNLFGINTISPKPCLTTQVDILILTTYNKVKYSFQAFADCLPSHN